MASKMLSNLRSTTKAKPAGKQIAKLADKVYDKFACMGSCYTHARDVSTLSLVMDNTIDDIEDKELIALLAAASCEYGISQKPSGVRDRHQFKFPGVDIQEVEISQEDWKEAKEVVGL